MFFDYAEAEVRICVEEWTIASQILNREVSGVIYQPEYLSATGPLHLLLLNDGQDLVTMQYDRILTRTLQHKNIQSVLTVGIKAGNRLQEYGVSGQPDFKERGSEAHHYRQFIVQELLPFIHSHTSRAAFSSYTIAGFSLGALSALDIAWHESTIFSRVGAFSGSFWWRSKEYTPKNPDKHRIAHQVIRQTNDKPNLKFWFQAGTQDEKSDRNQNGIIDSIDDTTSLIAELYRKGYERNTEVRYVELLGGRHDITTWGKIMPEFLCWAFRN
ncbi:esterase family protein [Adhaeribacter swui]|uniref:Esterase family protein n=1 Tax=Adhaeribacter swui TaxID=2086471 RepID=A0A7G7GBT3_9BACT|nr:alpha/beta hydrolase-fold protein [Adhaeribacter swui]QNF34617.1 esterase family protein [Adhaeribacter swui]